jgi:hypothetical protein
MPDVFISYSRKDKEFAEKLVRALEADGRDVWIDFDDIPFASEWWEEICNGIDLSEATIFIISPDSLESKVCGMEVNYAIKNHKRLIPILYREVKDVPIPADVSHLNWISFNESAVFENAYRKLIETIDTDLTALRQHTRLLLRAKEWEKKGHSSSLLLRGDELSDLKRMLTNPDITDLQRQYLEHSLRRERQTQMLMRFALGFLGGFLGIGFWAFSAFRSSILITPQRLIYTLALGQVFGLFVGLMSMLAGDMWWDSEQRLPPPIRFGLRIGGCLLLGVLAWGSYLWFLESLAMTPSDLNAVLLGGVGLAAGFIIRIMFPSRLPGWLAVLIMAVCAWLPIYITYTQFQEGSETYVPLIYFDNPDQLYSIAIPLVLLIALGANAQAISQELSSLMGKIRARRT